MLFGRAPVIPHPSIPVTDTDPAARPDLACWFCRPCRFPCSWLSRGAEKRDALCRCSWLLACCLDWVQVLNFNCLWMHQQPRASRETDTGTLSTVQARTQPTAPPSTKDADTHAHAHAHDIAPSPRSHQTNGLLSSPVSRQNNPPPVSSPANPES